MAADVVPPSAAPRDAASVILARQRAATGQAELLLLRRHSRSGFMASAFVFPGGVAEPGDRDPRETAARELFEEAGVLLVDGEVSGAERRAWRGSLRDGAPLTQLLERAGARLASEALHPFAHWITPSIETRRFSARFFAAELPAGQAPTVDDRETVDLVWVTPEEALARAGELRLPPPQVRTMYDLLEAAARGPRAVLALADERARHPHPVVPRALTTPSQPGGIVLLLPWDPEYGSAPGDGIEIPPEHPLARGPSRFVLGDQGWQLVSL
jgi:8-oxo-dGTP pyrophosphatase MutT (NUDIX family)